MERKCELGGGDIAESWQNSLEANGTPKLANNCEVTSPACEYTEWTDQNCVENMRQQTREELTGYDYCTEELSREIEDDTCEVVSNEINITGRGCWLDNYRWKCDRNSELIVSDENITVNIPKKDITQTFAVVNKKEFRSLTIYKAKAGGKHYTLVINNKTNIVVGFGFGLHFRGGVVE